MAVPYYGDFPVNHTSVVIPFNAFTSDDPSASATITDFAATDVHIHKNGSLTQRASSSGVAIDIDVDGITGSHWITIDLSDNDDAGFYAAGSEISVRVEGVTIDGATINAFVGAFSIERAGGVLALLKAGTVKVDVETIKTQAITCGAGVTIRADVGAAAAPGASNGMLIGGSNAATTFATLSVTGQLDAGNVLVDGTTVLTGTTTLTGAVSLGSTLGVTGATTLASLSVTGQLDAGSVLVDAGMDIVGALSANSLLIDTTTTLTGAVSLGSTLDIVGALSANSLLIDTTTTLTGNVSLGGTLGVTGATTLASLSITGALDANSLLIDTTTTLTGNVALGGTLEVTGTTTLTDAVSAPAGITADITGALSGAVGSVAGNVDGSVGSISGITFPTNFGDLGIEVTTGKIEGVILVDTCTTNTDMRGTDGANTTVPDAAGTAAALHVTTDAAITALDAVVDTVKVDTAAIKIITDALTAAAAAKLALSAGTIVAGTVSHDNTAASTTVFYSDDITEAAADHWNGRIVIFTSGALQYQATDITDYELASGEGKFTVTALTTAPADNVTFIIV